jgi:hypothetical protein
MSMYAIGWGVMLGLLGSNAAYAESWAPPSREFARYGVQTVVCNRAGQVPICLGLACRNRAWELVSVAGGGGPMEGLTRVFNGKRSYTLNFLFDPRAIDQLGLAASRVKLSSNQVSALADATEITLTAGHDPRIRHSFPLRNQAQEWRRVRASCRTASFDDHSRGKVDKDGAAEADLPLASTMLLASRTSALASVFVLSTPRKV